jgi:hypothetical protein
MSINSSKCTDIDYINFLIGSPTVLFVLKLLVVTHQLPMLTLMTVVKKFIDPKKGYLIADLPILKLCTNKCYRSNYKYYKHNRYRVK